MTLIRYALMLVFVMLTQRGVAAPDASLRKSYDKARPYLLLVQQQPDWLTSRLQMYWYSHATDVFIDGEKLDHAGGQRAPVPTVRLNGSRSNDGTYSRPRLADIVPYDDDESGRVTYLDAQGRPEKVHPSKTGCAIASVNQEILSIVAAAAHVYHEDGDTAYARMAAAVLDTYLSGIYYRNVPIDLNRGHQQTLVGLTTFEVIHEDAVTPVTRILRWLGNYVPADRATFYHAALKRWADNIIANGVPHNNWNLFQASFVKDIALVLRPDSAYADGHGRDYYLDCILHRSSVRQWSFDRLLNFGFDSATAVWYESPGYSMAVLDELCGFANSLHRDAGIDVVSSRPILARALHAAPQYLFPNRMVAGFGDTHPNYFSTRGLDSLLAYARRSGADSLARQLTLLREAVQPQAPAALIERYVTPTFYAPNVSWLVQRTGMDARHDLMVSLNGSLGNHQHANGISMELYGKGFVLGPDAGIGRNLYSGNDYLEYYSQFPAHNTVCVDGVSSYPVMMSQHAFEVEECHPAPGSGSSYEPVTWSQVAFIEPETQARQVRVNGIVKTSATGGYYVDIFRSRRTDGRDRTHDYFYHNLGQAMTVTRADGRPLAFSPADEPAFAGGHLYAYSYLRDMQRADGSGNLHATFVTTLLDSSHITMNLWMRGDSGRTVTQALSPPNLEYERMPGQPYDIEHQPVLTLMARQQGQAWTRPFVCVYEPVSDAEPSEIAEVSYFTPRSSDPSAVGICVRLKSGRTDYIFSSPQGSKMSYKGMTVKQRYAVITR